MHRSLASRSALALLFALALAGGAAAQQAPEAAPAAPCGGDLSAFLDGVKKMRSPPAPVLQPPTRHSPAPRSTPRC